MVAQPISLLEALAQIPDPRSRQGRRHSLQAMLATVIAAVLCGARGVTAIGEWIQAQKPEVWHRLGYYRRPPRAGAFRKLLLALDPKCFEQVLTQWVLVYLGASEEEQDVLRGASLDGKCLSSTLSRHGPGLHLLALLDQQSGCVLAESQVGSTNEAKAAVELIRKQVLPGQVITGDAMFCQREVCRAIIDQNAHYLLVVKANQRELQEAIASEFQEAVSPLGRASASAGAAGGPPPKQCPRPSDGILFGKQPAFGRLERLAGPGASVSADASDATREQRDGGGAVCDHQPASVSSRGQGVTALVASSLGH